VSEGDRSASWLRPAEAATRLGVTPDAVRARIRRGTLEARPGNDGRLRVLVAPVVSATATGHDTDLSPDGRDGPPTATGHDTDTTRHDGDRSPDWRLLAEEEGRRAARAEGELAAELRRGAELVASLAAALHQERARADRLEAALAEARRPWLARVLEGLRRKGG
jgi:hypothetical protein